MQNNEKLNNQPDLDTEFESIVPWNGEHDTGYDVRKKLERNFQKVSDNFYNLVSYFITLINQLDSRFLMKVTQDKTDFLLRLLGGIITDDITSSSYSPGAMGVGMKIGFDELGRSYAELDKLYIRMKAVFQELSVLQTTTAGNSLLLNPSGAKIQISKVELLDKVPVCYSDGSEKYFSDGSRAYVKAGKYGNVYRCYFLSDDGETAIKNLFRIGNFARCQASGIAEGVYENVGNKYYWRRVDNVGDNYIDLSEAYCDVDSDIPAEGDIVIQLGDESDVDYQSAIFLNSYGDGSPSITLYYGINDFTLAGKEIFSVGYDTRTKKCFVKSFGYSFFGDRERTSYIEFDDETKSLNIKANVEITGGFSDEIAKNIGYDDYAALKDAAMKDKALIKGGYINAKLIKADTMITSDLIASAIKTDELNVNDNFKVTKSGNLYARDAVFEGNITAINATFRDLSLVNVNIQSNEDGDRLVLSADERKFKMVKSDGAEVLSIAMGFNPQGAYLPEIYLAGLGSTSIFPNQLVIANPPNSCVVLSSQIELTGGTSSMRITKDVVSITSPANNIEIGSSYINIYKNGTQYKAFNGQLNSGQYIVNGIICTKA